MIGMDYYKVIEFLVQDVAKKDELIAMLEAKLNSSDVKALNDELKNMTIEKDHWKEEALEYRNEKEPEWWEEKKQYEREIEHLKSSIVSINQDRIKVLSGLEDKLVEHYEERIAKLQVEINHLKNNK